MILLSDLRRHGQTMLSFHGRLFWPAFWETARLLARAFSAEGRVTPSSGLLSAVPVSRLPISKLPGPPRPPGLPEQQVRTVLPVGCCCGLVGFLRCFRMAYGFGGPFVTPTQVRSQESGTDRNASWLHRMSMSCKQLEFESAVISSRKCDHLFMVRVEQRHLSHNWFTSRGAKVQSLTSHVDCLACRCPTAHICAVALNELSDVCRSCLQAIVDAALSAEKLQAEDVQGGSGASWKTPASLRQTFSEKPHC